MTCIKAAAALTQKYILVAPVVVFSLTKNVQNYTQKSTVRLLFFINTISRN